ncbi:hypothetical protein GWE18_14540 [Bradyrhizobium sp. CSA112]|uniref:hypothetical protein n=1 Tax=Bradyrhizobium sp. CSA112 TaxID=2699170 RepID=UPI0023B182CE|nr:hypothetical protein [Bradyrhizobium sp. CSA112]MDE5454060.1 hypothetical protein [Bradyrhizobium sp. CSA112]
MLSQEFRNVGRVAGLVDRIGEILSQKRELARPQLVKIQLGPFSRFILFDLVEALGTIRFVWSQFIASGFSSVLIVKEETMPVFILSAVPTVIVLGGISYYFLRVVH